MNIVLFCLLTTGIMNILVGVATKQEKTTRYFLLVLATLIFCIYVYVLLATDLIIR